MANCGMPWYLLMPLTAILFLCTIAILLMIIGMFRDGL